MKINMKCDNHTHTFFSVDSTEEMENYCIQALKRGVDVICFTEHIDYNPADMGYKYHDLPVYFDCVKAMRDKYSDDLTILGGIEFSEPHMYRKELEEIKSYPFDYIIGSVHYWVGDIFPSVMPETVPVELCYERYWAEVKEAVLCGGFDALGHIDFPKRYYKKLIYNSDTISEIFEIMIKNGIVLEVNTSSLRKGLTEPMPNFDILKLYRECGGEYVTFGSDAHDAKNLYADVGECKEWARRLGFSEVYFKNRKMVMV